MTTATKTQQHIQDILLLCDLHDIEIVSYGLAPNPNGFCYERGEATTNEACQWINDVLDSLNKEEIKELRGAAF